jgi:Protein of unknwon function (DUF3310)
MEIKVGGLYANQNGDVAEVRAIGRTHVKFKVHGGDYNTTLGDFITKYPATAGMCGSVAGGSPVHSPQHYQVFPDKEAIEIIASSMTTEQFYGYCLGNFLKYRLRIGAKDEVQQELGKSNKYKELYEKHKHLCK